MIKNITRSFLMAVLLLMSASSFAQNIRGFYLQDIGTWLGNTTKEDDILTYAQGNGFNYILLYDLGSVSWNNAAQKNKLAAFMTKARNQYGIIQIGGVVEYSGYVTQNIIPYNNSRTSPLEKFDVINFEFEFWVMSTITSSYCNKFLSAAGFSCDTSGAWAFAWREFKLIDDICANNGMTSEFYMGWPNKGQLQQIASRADRILLSAYRPTDSDIYLYSKNRMKDISTIGGQTKILTLMSSESAFMGSWLNSHPQTQPYHTMDAALISETQPFKQNIDLQGYQWFTYKYMPKTVIATATITANGPLTFCPGGSVDLTANSGTAYLWSPGGQTTQTITVTNSGSYSVSVTGATGTSVTSSVVVVNSSGTGLAPVITASGPTSICNGGSVVLSTIASPSYLWSTGATTQSISVSNAGLYTVTTGGNCGGISAPITINSVSPPAVPTITSNGAVDICPGSTITLTSTSANGYLWSNGATTNSITVSAAGNYTVLVFSGPGCSAVSSATAVTHLSAPATPTVNVSGSTVLSPVNTSIVLTSSAANNYLWNTAETTNSITVATQGNYHVTITGTNGCQATSNNVVVTYNSCVPPALPTITLNGPSALAAGQTVILTSSTSGGYLWSTGETTPSITVSTPGTYTVRSYSAGSCFSTSLPTIITSISTGQVEISGTENSNSINIYPNPASEIVNVVFNQISGEKDVTFILTDITGREIYSRELTSTIGENSLQLDVASFPKGIYFVRLLDGGQVRVKKILVE